MEDLRGWEKESYKGRASGKGAAIPTCVDSGVGCQYLSVGKAAMRGHTCSGCLEVTIPFQSVHGPEGHLAIYTVYDANSLGCEVIYFMISTFGVHEGCLHELVVESPFPSVLLFSHLVVVVLLPLRTRTRRCVGLCYGCCGDGIVGLGFQGVHQCRTTSHTFTIA